MYRYDPEQITFFAKTDARGQEVPFGIKANDRTRHVYVIGKTGMGKSTLLENMAVQDIKNGNGLAFIDPHGQTAETILSYIPKERVDDVLYFAPFDTDYPIAFNVMEDVEPDRRHLVVSGLMSVFKKIWVDAWSARMEYILSNTLLALLEYPDSTLLGVNRMLSDKAYRKKVVDNITDPSVRSFWVDEFANYNERYMQEAGDAIKNKIGQFTSNPLIRNIVGQPKSSFDIRKIMDERKILIMNLSKGLVGEQNANLLGSMLTTRIYLAAMSRADLTQTQMKDMPNFYFYVDEFQSFANATFANILSEARKYKLNLTIAHQYIEQMEEEVRNAVFGNVGTTIAFRVGPFDAEVLESIFTPKFLAPDIVNLGFAQIYLTLMIDGIGSQPFSAVTLPPIKVPETSFKEDVLVLSRKKYAHPRAGVEAIIRAWHEEKVEIPKPTDKKTSIETPKQNSNGEFKKSVPTDRPRPAANNNRPTEPLKRKPEPVRHSGSEAKFEKPPKTETKSTDELRAILRTIATSADPVAKEKPIANQPAQTRPIQSAPSTTASQRTTIKPEKTNMGGVATPPSVSPAVPSSAPPSVPSANVSSLKAALAAVLAEKQEETVVNKTAFQVEKTAALPVSPVSPSPITVTSTSTPSSVESKDDKNQDEDPLSPKKLERMMRITGNDRTPLG